MSKTIASVRLMPATFASPKKNRACVIRQLQRPAQIANAAVNGGEQEPHVVAAPEHQATGDRRDHLDVGRERGHQRVDAVRLRGCAIAGDRVVHFNDYGGVSKAKTSAGLLPYRIRAGRLEVLIAHMGGPFWANRDDGAWSIVKGEYDEREDAYAAARREFAEETGEQPPQGPALEWARFASVAASDSSHGRSRATSMPRRSTATPSRSNGLVAQAGSESSPRSTVSSGWTAPWLGTGWWQASTSWSSRWSAAWARIARPARHRASVLTADAGASRSGDRAVLDRFDLARVRTPHPGEARSLSTAGQRTFTAGSLLRGSVANEDALDLPAADLDADVLAPGEFFVAHLLGNITAKRWA